MDQHRVLVRLSHCQSIRQCSQVVTVNGSVVTKAHILKHGGLIDPLTNGRIHIGKKTTKLAAHFGNAGQKMLYFAFKGKIGPGGANTGQVFCQSTYVFADRHIVIVENNDQIIILRAGVVQRLIGQTAGHSAVADHSNHLALFAPQRFCLSQTNGLGNSRRTVAGGKNIVLALVRSGKTADAALGAQGNKIILASGEDLVGIALVTHIKDNGIGRAVKHPVQRHGQLHHAQIGGQVPAVMGHSLHQQIADL